MNKTIGRLLVFYALTLGAVSYLIHHLSPALSRASLLAGLIGGALCLVWGIRGIISSGGKALPLLTLIPINVVLLWQTLAAWGNTNSNVQGAKGGAMLFTLLLVLSLGMLLRIAWSGVVFDLPGSGPPQAGGARAGANTTAKKTT